MCYEAHDMTSIEYSGNRVKFCVKSTMLNWLIFMKLVTLYNIIVGIELKIIFV